MVLFLPLSLFGRLTAQWKQNADTKITPAAETDFAVISGNTVKTALGGNFGRTTAGNNRKQEKH